MGGYFVIDWLVLGLILFILLFFGTLYAVFVNLFFDQLQGYMSLMVVGGVLVTLGFSAFIFWPAAVLLLICFSASGLPMIIGDIVKAIRKRERVKNFSRTIANASEEELNRLINAASRDYTTGELDNDS